MHAKFLSAAALALAASTLVSAQTFTECDPTKKECPPDPALADSIVLDLTKGEPSKYFKNLAGTKVTYDKSLGAVFSIKTDGDAPTMASHHFIFFGRVDVTLQAAPGAGVVTSFVLQSDDLDEIDLEWVGGDNAQVQSNYFSKGDTSTYDRGAYHPVANPTGQFHTYSIDWTKDHVQWLIDGAVVRTLTYAEAKGGSTFPQTPMQVKFGTWVAGKKDAAKGTIEWAGGLTNFANAPFVGYYKEIKITDNMGGVKGAKQYIYSDKSGTWQSIKVDTVNGPANSTDDQNTTSGTKTGTAKTTLTTSTSQSTGAPAASTTSGGSAPTGAGAGAGSRTSTSATSVPTSAAGRMVMASGSVALAGVAFIVAHLFVL